MRQSRKVLTGIRSTPAGMEIRLRKIGIIRPKNTAFTPCRRNHASVLVHVAELDQRKPGDDGAHPVAPQGRAEQVERERAHAPTRAWSRRSHRSDSSVPALATNPANGRITSLGIGGKRFSNATARRHPAHRVVPPGR